MAAAVERGELAEARYSNYIRLMKEAAYHEQSAIEKREQDRKLGRFYRSVQRFKDQDKGN